MKKNDDFTPEERDSINAALTEALAVLYPDLEVTPYKGSAAADEKGGVQCQTKSL